MCNSIKKENKNQAFYLSFEVMHGNSSDFLDYDLPYPHFLHHHAHFSRYVIAWAIMGYFATTASKEFLLDVVARFILAFPTATRLPWKPELRESGHTYNREALELKEFAKHLPSLPWSHTDTKLADFVATGLKRKAMTSEDALFEATRWHLYRRAYAEGTTENITEDYVQILLETENELLTHKKSSGDIRSKARNMAAYMQEKFVVYTDIEGYADWSKERRAEYMRDYRKQKGITMATRSEHLKKVHANRNAKAKAKIKAVLEDMFIQDQIRFKNGKYRIGVIAQITDLTEKTVSKHLKEMLSNKKEEN